MTLPNGSHAVIALGSNLGYRRKTLLSALSSLMAHPRILVDKISPMVLSEPVGASHDGTIVEMKGQPPYLNMVAEIKVALPALDLLRITQKLEDRHGRIRGQRWACRTLDIDVITYGSTSMHTVDLVLPHPRAWERAFVLYPWSLMDPDALLGSSLVRDLVSRASDRDMVRLLSEGFADTFVEAPSASSFRDKIDGSSYGA